MLERAAADGPAGGRIRWCRGDLARWEPRADEPAPELVFSNAALHWLDDHARLFPRLFAAVAAGGVLAVQMPDQFHAPSHVALADVAGGPRWRERLGAALRPVPVARRRRPTTSGSRRMPTRIDLWSTEYLHVLPAADDGEHPVVAWTRGTALTPVPGARSTPISRRAFLDEYRDRVAAAYPPRPDGTVLFAFRRQFLVATRRRTP